MKRNAIVLFVTLLFAVLQTQAQGFHMGIKAGANLFKVDGQSFDQSFKFGFNAGAFAELNFTSSFGIQPELLFNQTNYRTGTQFSDVYSGGVNNYEGKLNYLSIPILLSFRPIPLLSLQAGPQFGILLNKDEHLTYNAQQAFKNGDLSVVAGAQLNLASVKVGARYVIGLNNINDLPQESNWKNQGWQLYAGFRIF